MTRAFNYLSVGVCKVAKGIVGRKVLMAERTQRCQFSFMATDETREHVTES